MNNILKWNDIYLYLRRACGFSNLVWTLVYRVGIICPPGWDRVKVDAKTWCGRVPTSKCPQARLWHKVNSTCVPYININRTYLSCYGSCIYLMKKKVMKLSHIAKYTSALSWWFHDFLFVFWRLIACPCGPTIHFSFFYVPKYYPWKKPSIVQIVFVKSPKVFLKT